MLHYNILLLFFFFKLIKITGKGTILPSILNKSIYDTTHYINTVVAIICLLIVGKYFILILYYKMRHL